MLSHAPRLIENHCSVNDLHGSTQIFIIDGLHKLYTAKQICNSTGSIR